MNPLGKYSSGSLGTNWLYIQCYNQMLETEMGIPEEYSQLNVIQKEMLVNSTPKLNSVWMG